MAPDGIKKLTDELEAVRSEKESCIKNQEFEKRRGPQGQGTEIKRRIEIEKKEWKTKSVAKDAIVTEEQHIARLSQLDRDTRLETRSEESDCSISRLSSTRGDRSG